MWKSPLFLRATWSKNFRVWQKKLSVLVQSFLFLTHATQRRKSMVFHKQSRHFFFVKRRRLFYSIYAILFSHPNSFTQHFSYAGPSDPGSRLGFQFPTYLFYFLGVGESEESIGILGIKNSFLRNPRGFEESIFSWFCVYERQKKCKILKWRLNWIKEFVKLIQWKDSLDYFFNFITEYYWVKHSKFSLNNWSILLLISIILLLRDLEERLMRMKTIFWSLGFEELNFVRVLGNKFFGDNIGKPSHQLIFWHLFLLRRANYVHYITTHLLPDFHTVLRPCNSILRLLRARIFLFLLRSLKMIHC